VSSVNTILVCRASMLSPCLSRFVTRSTCSDFPCRGLASASRCTWESMAWVTSAAGYRDQSPAWNRPRALALLRSRMAANDRPLDRACRSLFRLYSSCRSACPVRRYIRIRIAVIEVDPGDKARAGFGSYFSRCPSSARSFLNADT